MDKKIFEKMVEKGAGKFLTIFRWIVRILGIVFWTGVVAKYLLHYEFPVLEVFALWMVAQVFVLTIYKTAYERILHYTVNKKRLGGGRL